MLDFGLAAMLFTAQPGDAFTAEASPQPIIGGEPTEPGEFESVVAIVGPGFICTGTAVTQSLVLTAAHCFNGAPDVEDVEIAHGSQLSPQRMLPIRAYGTHPAYTGDIHGKDIHDYAYLVLDTPLSPPGGFVKPLVDQDEWDAAMRIGAPAMLVGFGRASNDDELADGRKRKVLTRITRFTDSGLEFFAGGDGRDSCQGDSGGPAFVQLDDGTVRFAGILSRGSEPCGDGGYYGIAYGALDWVLAETGVNLLPPGCESADCLDTRMNDGGCRVAGRSSISQLGFAVVLMLLGGRRRRWR